MLGAIVSHRTDCPGSDPNRGLLRELFDVPP